MKFLNIVFFTLSIFLIPFAVDAQFGGLIKKPKVPKVKVPKTSTSGNSSSNSGSNSNSSSSSGSNSSSSSNASSETSESPAKSAMGSFDRYAEKMQYCLDNKTWSDQNRNGYSSILGYAKRDLDKIKEKDAAAAPDYETRYNTYKKAWDDYQQALADAKAATQKAEKEKLDAFFDPIEDDGITSDFHKTNVNKIVFSTEKINLENPDASKAKTDFKLNEPIFMRLYLDKSMGNYYRGYMKEKRDGKERDHWTYFYLNSKRNGTENGVDKYEYTASSQEAKLIYKIFIDGKEFRRTWYKDYAEVRNDQHGEVVDKWTSWWTEIIPVEKERYYEVSDPVSAFGEIFALSAPGKHNIKIETWLCHHDKSSDLLDKIAEGEFNVSFSESEQKAYRKVRGRLMPKVGMSDSGLESKMKSMYSKKFEDVKLKRLIITSERWEVKKNDIDIPVKKLIWASAAIEKNGEFRIVDVVFRRDYEGGGSYGSMYLSTADHFEDGDRIHGDDLYTKP